MMLFIIIIIIIIYQVHQRLFEGQVEVVGDSSHTVSFSCNQGAVSERGEEGRRRSRRNAVLILFILSTSLPYTSSQPPIKT